MIWFTKNGHGWGELFQVKMALCVQWTPTCLSSIVDMVEQQECDNTRQGNTTIRDGCGYVRPG